MVKTEKLSGPVLTALFVLAVFLIAVFALSTNANADGLDVDADTDVASTLSSYFSGIGLRNQEYPDANFINFLLCLHGYEALPDDATVTVTAYLPVTNTVFWRSTFTKDYLVLKDAVNIVGHGTVLRLPGACTLKIEVNGADIDGWDLIYGSTVEEATIWHMSSGLTGTATDYVPGNATYMFMSNVGGHVVHLAIDGVHGNGSNPGGDVDDPDNPGGDNPGGDNPGGDNPGGDNPGGDNPGGDNPGGDNPGGDNPDTPDKPSNPDDPNTPDKPSNPDNPNTPDKPSNPDNPNTPDKPTEPKTPSETGDTRSVVMMSAIAVISLAVLAGTYRKKKAN